jgi:1-acyl-sn-glycerol-3-phosphate acyltransferase
MYRLCRILFVLLVARPVTLFLLGLNVRNREKLDWSQPLIIVANHNSHLDTLVLLSLVPLKYIHRVHPAAAADYFLCKPLRAWFSRNWLGVVGVARERADKHPLAECQAALAQGHSLLLFPEGTRGEPEKMQAFKSGIAHLAKQHPQVPIVPIYMFGLGRALPKGEWVPIPFFCDVFVGDAVYWQADKVAFLAMLEAQFKGLREKLPATWMKD